MRLNIPCENDSPIETTRAAAGRVGDVSEKGRPKNGYGRNGTTGDGAAVARQNTIGPKNLKVSDDAQENIPMNAIEPTFSENETVERLIAEAERIAAERGERRDDVRKRLARAERNMPIPTEEAERLQELLRERAAPFADRAARLAWVAEWRRAYAWLSESIRTVRKNAGGKRDASAEQELIHALRGPARDMMDLRSETDAGHRASEKVRKATEQKENARIS
jgi:hypothetical protein